MISISSLVLILFFTSFLICFATIPFLIKLGEKLNYFDIPNKRKIHSNKKVRVGGISLFISVLSSIVSLLIFKNLQNFEYLDIHNIYFLISFSSMAFFIGLCDDILSISPFIRLILQIIFASLAFKYGYIVEGFSLNFFGLKNIFISFNQQISYFFTIFWIVGLTNAFNWIDGLDGLATGISSISLIPIIYISLMSSNTSVLIYSILLLASCLAFLKFNFFPSKIMMGDSGSYFLGSSLALISISVFTNNYNDTKSISILPFILFLIPIFDMTNVIRMRIFRKSSPFLPDKRHLHHQLLKLGLSHKNTVLFIYSICQFNSILTLSIFLEDKKFLIIISILVMLYSQYFLLRKDKIIPKIQGF